MNSPIQWFLLLLCDRRTAPTLFSTLAWYPPVGGTRRIGKDSPVHRPDGLRPSRRRITACDQRFEGYPSMLACYIRRAVGTHEFYITVRPDNDAPGLNSLVWGPPAPCTSPLLPTQHSRECVAKKQTPHSRCPRRDYVTRGHRQGGYIMFLFTTCRFCVICFQHTLVLFHIRWEPLATRPLCRITLPLSALLIIAKPPSRNARYINRE